MRVNQLSTEAIQLTPRSLKAQAWIDRVYAEFPQTWQNNHVMMLGGTGDDKQFAMFELVPSLSKRDAVEVKWFQAYPLRQGVGSRAMRVLQDMAQQDGIILTLYPWNKGQVSQGNLMKFYRGTGFRPTVKGAKTMAWEPSMDEGKISPADMARMSNTVMAGKQPPEMPAFRTSIPIKIHGYPVQFSQHFWDRWEQADPERIPEDKKEAVWKIIYFMLNEAFSQHTDEIKQIPLDQPFAIKKKTSSNLGYAGLGMVKANDKDSLDKTVWRVVTYHPNLRFGRYQNVISVWESQMVKEGLTHKDPVEKWIAVFKASTHPKFAGKTPEQRERMARMAQYRAVQNKKTFENMDHSKDSQAVPELRAALLARKRLIKSKAGDKDAVYAIINGLMTSIAKAHGISGQKIHDLWVDKYGEIPDTWILHESMLPGSHTPTEAVLAKQYTVGVAEIKRQLKKGIKTELEHTTDRAVAREIALDHLGENLYYYDQLKRAGLEEAWLDTNEYGGWITPNRKVEYVEDQGHEAHLRREHGLRIAEAFLAGFVRFQTNARTSTFSIEGQLSALRKTYRIWGQTALNARNVYIDIFQWRDDMATQGLTPHMMFRPSEGDKPQIIHSFGTKVAEPIAEAKKRRAKTIIDGMIKSLIKQGRTRDEAIADLKRQVDSRFYEHIDAAANMLTEDDDQTKMDTLVFKVGEAFAAKQPWDAIEFMEDADTTVDSDPRLRAVFDANMHQLADMLVQELRQGDADYGVLNQIAGMIDQIGIAMPDPKIARFLEGKRDLIDRIIGKNLSFAGISEVLETIMALEGWGIDHYYMEDFIDLEDGKDDVIRSLLKLIKSNRRAEVRGIIQRLRDEGWDWPEFAAFDKSLAASGNVKESQVDEAESSDAPTGVIFNGNVAYVGQTHGKPIKLSDELKKKIQDLAAKHGAWYEGNGADRAHTEDLIDKWQGSWDDVAAKSIKNYPPQFLYVLFSNVDANNTIKRVGVDPNGTIFDQILKNQNSGKFFPDRSYDAATLREFLGMISQKGSDFNEMAQQPATAENVRRFFKTGERLMWPSNWEEYPNPAGKVAKKANDHRDHWLATRKSGVYVMGAGHLLSVAKIGGFNLIGGESINDLNENITGDVDEAAKQRLDPKCWTGYQKQGTKLKNGVRVNNCVPKESVEENLTETRDAAFKWLKNYLPTWPDYVLRDWMYNHFRGDWDASGDDPKTVIQRTLDGEGMTPQTRWKFVPNFHFTFDSLDPDTVRRIKERQGGAVNPYGIPSDAERHATQATLAAQQGGVRDEPVILKKVGNKYELIEGWHRTIQHFKQFPNGYKGPAWIAIDAKPVSENFADGKGPGRKGDSQRHGIPKGATIAQLEKAAKASGRKGQLARWQINMRRGRAKAEESDQEMTADQWQALRKSDPREYLGIKDYRNRKWWESHFKAEMAKARVSGKSHFEFPPGTKMYYMVTKNPLEEGGSPPHGTPENELAMMKARTKPAVTFLDMGQYEELYEPNMEHYDWIKQKWRLPNMDVNYYVIGQPGQEARVKRIGQLIYDMNKAGGNPTADYHRELGRLLGYSEADINSFLKDLEKDH